MLWLTISHHIIYLNTPKLSTMKKLTPILENKAVDIYAHQPNVPHSAVAEQLGITDKTLMKLRRSPDFWQKVYQEFLVAMECDIPDIVRAMARESKAGNVQAGRLMLEWAGKLNKTLNINISSPFEQWLAQSGNNQIEEAEIVVGELPPLPPRTADNTPQKVQNDFIKLDKELQKKQSWNKRRRELHRWNQRAKTCGIEPLPARRPTKGQRLAWEESIIKAELEYGGK